MKTLSIVIVAVIGMVGVVGCSAVNSQGCIDTDNDGLCNVTDICPYDYNNACFTECKYELEVITIDYDVSIVFGSMHITTISVSSDSFSYTTDQGTSSIKNIIAVRECGGVTYMYFEDNGTNVLFIKSSDLTYLIWNKENTNIVAMYL